MIWLLSCPPYEHQKRLSLLFVSAVLEGASVGPLIKVAIDVDPSILITAFVGTAIAFVCFSAAAMLARRREYLYLGGLLSSGLSMLMWLQFASSIFGGSASIFKFELYFGLLIFVGYMVVDTQEIIEKAHLGDMDYVKHSLTLFTDFVAVFVRILIIMVSSFVAGIRKWYTLFVSKPSLTDSFVMQLKNSADKEEKKKKRRN